MSPCIAQVRKLVLQEKWAESCTGLLASGPSKKNKMDAVH